MSLTLHDLNLAALAPEILLMLGICVFLVIEAVTGRTRPMPADRLALATLVVSGANVLLLDEPTNNLDPASREEILGALGTYEGAVVLVTHDEGAVEALSPDRVLLLPDGDEDLWSDSYLELVTLA